MTGTSVKYLLSALLLALGLTIGLLGILLDGQSSLVHAQAGSGTIRVAVTGTDTFGCGGEANPCATIQYALDQANPDEEIHVAAGTYTGVSGQSVPVGYPNPPASGVITQVVYVDKDDITIRGGYTVTNWTTPDPVANLTIIDAQGQGRGLVIAGNIALTITGLHLVNGNAAGLEGSWSGPDDTAGGGVYILSANAILSNTTISNSTADYGGGVYLHNSGAVLNSNTIYSNTAQARGGGLYLRLSNATITSNTISGNTTIDNDGGGVYLDNSDSVTLTSNTVTNNRAAQGGGVRLHFSDAILSSNTIYSNTTTSSGGGLFLHTSGAVLTGNTIYSNSGSLGGGLYLYASTAVLTSNTVSGNSAITTSGGGLYLTNSDATLSNNTVSGNTAATIGGGVYLINSNNATMGNNTISGNVAQFAGGVHLNQSDVTLTNNIISNNIADSQGGGLFIGTSHPTLVNNAILGNQASTLGSGIYLGGAAAHLIHNTIADNSNGDGIGVYLSSGSSVVMTNTILANHNVGLKVFDASTTTLNGVLWYSNTTNAEVSTGLITVTNAYTGNPVFAADGYHLTAASAAINRGLNAGLATDIDGETRDSQPDLGADELFTCFAQVSSLPGTTYNTLQSAVDAASNGDIVKAAGLCNQISGRSRPDEYIGPSVITQVVYITKEITLHGGYTTTNWTKPDPMANPTIVDARGQGRTLLVAGNIAPTIAGLHLTNGDASGLGGVPGNDTGGGIFVRTASVTLSNTHIYSNTAAIGAGIALFGRDSILRGNVIYDNTATNRGGGIAIGNSNPLLVNNAILTNHANLAGSGIWLADSRSRLLHNTIADNSGGDGSGIHITSVSGNSVVTLTNTILAQHSVGITVTTGNEASLDGVLWDNNTTNTGGSGSIIVNSQHSGDSAFAADGYHLTSASDAINRGSNAGIATDIDGQTRDSQPDLGADEASALLSISKTGPISATSGGIITYTLTVTNSGTVTSTDLLITDTIPVNANYITGGIKISNKVGWIVANLSAGDSLTRTFSVTATQTITNNDYSVTAANNVTAAGQVIVVTTIAHEGHRIYLPVVLKEQ